MRGSRFIEFFQGTTAVAPPPAFQWPDASNTGFRTAPTQNVGDLSTTSAGQVISGLNIAGTLTILHPNVTVTDCNFTTVGNYGCDNQALMTGLVVTHSTFSGMFTPIIGCGTFTYNNLSNMENGIICKGNGTVIKFNYIHDFNYVVTSHYDGIEVSGGNDGITIQFNTITNIVGQTSCVNLSNNDAISNVLIDTNKLSGGVYPVYVDGHFSSAPVTNVTVSNNILGAGSGGPISYVNFNMTTPAYFGNTDATTGAYCPGQSPEVIPGTVAFQSSTPFNADDANVNCSLRMVCTLTQAINGPFRIVIESSSVNPFVATHLSAGKGNGAAQGATIATPWEAKFSGASGLNMPAGEYVPSDLIDPGTTKFAVGDKLVVVMDIPTGTAGQRTSGGNTNVTTWFAGPGVSWNVAAPTGFVESANNNFSVRAIVI